MSVAVTTQTVAGLYAGRLIREYIRYLYFTVTMLLSCTINEILTLVDESGELTWLCIILNRLNLNTTAYFVANALISIIIIISVAETGFIS